MIIYDVLAVWSYISFTELFPLQYFHSTPSVTIYKVVPNSLFQSLAVIFAGVYMFHVV